MRQDKTIWTLFGVFAAIMLVSGVGMTVMMHHRSQDRVAQKADFLFDNDVVLNQPIFNEIAIIDNIAVPQGPALAAQDIARERGNVAAAKDIKITGPVAHGNLAVFMIHGEDQVKNDNILTLQEALDSGVAVVHDRGRLSIDNRSPTHAIFVQSGDIVKGGSQDRVLPYDQLVPPQTVNQTLAAFCVEQGRSGPRAGEISTSFSTSNEQLPGRHLKLAALYRKSQGDVWNQVTRTQANLSRNVGQRVNSNLSPTSLQLALENPRVEESTRAVFDKLLAAGRDQKDVIGVAIVVNGQIQSADVYGSAELFQKAWPKLLRAAAVDALAEQQSVAANTSPTAETVRTYLAAPDEAQGFTLSPASGVRLLQQEAGQTVRFDTCDVSRNNEVLHRSYLTK